MPSTDHAAPHADAAPRAAAPLPPLILPPPSGAAIRALRDRRGLTQAELAALCGCHANSIARAERGELALSGAAWACALLALGEHPGARLATLAADPVETSPLNPSRHRR